jgi:hypothetical protein
LDASEVGRSTHDSAERIYLTHNRTLGNPADGWIARHLTYGLEILRQQESSGPTSSRQRSCLGSGVPTAYDNDIISVLTHVVDRPHYRDSLTASVCPAPD